MRAGKPKGGPTTLRELNAKIGILTKELKIAKSALELGRNCAESVGRLEIKIGELSSRRDVIVANIHVRVSLWGDERGLVPDHIANDLELLSGCKKIKRGPLWAGQNNWGLPRA